MRKIRFCQQCKDIFLKDKAFLNLKTIKLSYAAVKICHDALKQKSVIFAQLLIRLRQSKAIRYNLESDVVSYGENLWQFSNCVGMYNIIKNYLKCMR